MGFYTLAALAARSWVEAPALLGGDDSNLAQMSLVTALSIAMSSVALLLAHRDGEASFARRQVAAATALAACAASRVAIFLYLAGVQQLYGSAGPPGLPSRRLSPACCWAWPS